MSVGYQLCLCRPWGAVNSLWSKKEYSPTCVFSKIALEWHGGWAGGEGLAKAYQEAGHSFIQSHLSSPSFIQPSPSLQGTLSSYNGLDERYGKGPGEWESAGLRALREN